MAAYLVQWTYVPAAFPVPHTLIIECAPEFAAQRALEAARKAATARDHRPFRVESVVAVPELGALVDFHVWADDGRRLVTVTGHITRVGDPEPSAAGGTFRRVDVTVKYGHMDASRVPIGSTVTMAQAQARPAMREVPEPHGCACICRCDVPPVRMVPVVVDGTPEAVLNTLVAEYGQVLIDQ